MTVLFFDNTLYIPTGTSDLYSPSGTVGHIHNITIHNTNTTTETVTINKKVSSTDWEQYKLSVVANDTILLSFAGEGWLIKSGNKITGKTTTPSKVVFDVSVSEDM